MQEAGREELQPRTSRGAEASRCVALNLLTDGKRGLLTVTNGFRRAGWWNQCLICTKRQRLLHDEVTRSIRGHLTVSTALCPRIDDVSQDFSPRSEALENGVEIS